MSSKTKERIGYGVLYVFLAIITILILFPIVHAILGSFKDNLELTTGGAIFPRKWVFDNYKEAWKQADFAKYTWNSLFICFFVTIGALILSSMAGYVVARKEFKGKKLFMVILVSTMFISVGAITLRPLYLLMVGLFEFRTAWNSYIVPSIFTMNTPHLRPLTVGVISMKYTSGAAVQWNLMFAGACISIIPMLIIFILANKTFMDGLISGAVKG